MIFRKTDDNFYYILPMIRRTLTCFRPSCLSIFPKFFITFQHIIRDFFEMTCYWRLPSLQIQNITRIINSHLQKNVCSLSKCVLGLQRYPKSFSFLSSYLKEKFKEVDIYICLNEKTTETFVQTIDILHMQNFPKLKILEKFINFGYYWFMNRGEILLLPYYWLFKFYHFLSAV